MNSLLFRPASKHDLPSIIDMLADDPLGQMRETNIARLKGDKVERDYLRAFEAIDGDPNNHLIIAEVEVSGRPEIVGVLQLTFIASLTYEGGTRAQVEGVRVHKKWRNQHIGKQLLHHAINVSKERGCALIQLTSDRKRDDALSFYERLGFVKSHWGFKLQLRDH